MIKKYFVLSGLFLITGSGWAMEDDPISLSSSPVFSPSSSTASSSSSGSLAPRMSWWQVVSWPFRPFEVVDSKKNIEKYKQVITYQKDVIRPKPSDYELLGEQQQKRVNYLDRKLKTVIDNKEDLPTRDQILIYKYGYKCLPLRVLLKFVHGKPYSYCASALYYAGLIKMAVKIYRTIQELEEHKKEQRLQATHAQGKERHHHPDCAWCAMHGGRARQS